MDKKSVSDAKVSANRRNAKKSAGPNETSSTRFNATKHGLLSEGITELDDTDGYRETLRRLDKAYLDEVDTFLVGRIALHMVRLRRTARLEAEFITSVLNPPTYGESPLSLPSFDRPVLDPGLQASINSESVKALVETYQRYETANENKLYRAMNQLERIRRIQKGEHLPAPVAVDVSVHSESPCVDSTGTVPILESSQFQSAAHRGHKAGTQGASANETIEQHPPEVSESARATEEPD